MKTVSRRTYWRNRARGLRLRLVMRLSGMKPVEVRFRSGQQTLWLYPGDTLEVDDG